MKEISRIKLQMALNVLLKDESKVALISNGAKKSKFLNLYQGFKYKNADVTRVDVENALAWALGFNIINE